MLLVERRGVQTPISYASRPLQDTKTCYTPTEKTVLALIHTTRSLRTIFRKHQIKIVTNGLMEEILKISGTEGRLAKWAAEIRIYNISYIQTNEAGGQMVNKFLRQKEPMPRMLSEKDEGPSRWNKKPQAELTPTPRPWRLYLSREANKEGSGVGMILISPNEKMYSYAIRLNFNAPDDNIDYKALLAGLVMVYPI
ncbi:reverse transcriptase domain-containing protein [Tanacetum coccineum]|uniref:Reverse transcriptase domain-containing protein n=1 Tax=Tanacetum coccineum TaxID=301880 RepID=A0ABQ5CQY2_9ASTR